MAKPYSVPRFLALMLLCMVITAISCQTSPAPAPAPKKAEKPSPKASAAATAESQAAAQRAFEELDNPDRPVPKASTPKAPAPAQQPAPAKQSSPASSQKTTPAKPAAPAEDKNARAVAPSAPEPKMIGGQRQDWVDGTSKNYPATRYLTAVGSGPDRKQAEGSARAEIAKIFVTHVNSSTKIQQEYLKEVSKGKSTESSREIVEDMVQLSTQKVLSGVWIAEVYRQEKPQVLFYALAVLDRQQTMTTLKEKINTLDQEIKRLMAQAVEEKKELQKIKVLTAAIEKHTLRQAHEAELTVADPSGRGLPAPISFEEIKRPLNDILSKNFRIHVAVSGDRGGEIQKALSQGLTQEGFVLIDNIKQAKVAVKGKVTITPLEKVDEKWTYVRWQTVFELVDLSDQTVFGTLSNNGREGHLNREQAVNRAVMKIQKDLLPIVSKDVHNYISGQSTPR